MAKDTCTSCGGSGVVKKKIQQETPNPSMGSAKEKNPTKPKDYKFKSNAQRKSPPKEKK